MRCAWVQDRLLLYQEGELSPAESARLLQHLETCEACARHLETLLEIHERVEASIKTSLEAPATLQPRVMEAVRQLPPRRAFRVPLLSSLGGSRFAFAGVSAGLVLLGFRLGLYASQQRRLAPSLATVDVQTLGLIHHRVSPSPEVATADLRRTLGSRVRFPVLPVDLRPEGAELVGGDQSRVQGVPVAQLHYQWKGPGGKQARVSLFEVDSHRLALPAMARMAGQSESYLVEKRAGQVIVMWKSDRPALNNVMIAEAMPMHLLFQLACHACENQEQL